MDNYSVDTVSLLRVKIDEYNSGYHTMEACDAELREQCPNGGLDLGDLHPVDLYMVEVAFEFIRNPAQRKRFKNIGTNFHLPAQTVEDLQNIGCTLLRQDPELQELLAGDGRSREADGLLGMNVLRNFRFEIDQDSALLNLRPRR